MRLGATPIRIFCCAAALVVAAWGTTASAAVGDSGYSVPEWAAWSSDDAARKAVRALTQPAPEQAPAQQQVAPEPVSKPEPASKSPPAAKTNAKARPEKPANTVREAPAKAEPAAAKAPAPAPARVAAPARAEPAKTPPARQQSARQQPARAEAVKAPTVAPTPVRTAAVAPAATPRAAARLRQGEGFEYRGRFVRVEAFRGYASNAAPAVVILHGASGLGDGTLFYPQAQALQERGISAFVVHYFDGLRGTRNPAAPAFHDERERIVNAALDYVQALPYVDGTRIGVFGLSLGGFQAVSLASRDERVQAVVNVIGAMPAQVMREGVSRMPPTLILHGDRDRTVPVRRAKELASLLDQLGTPYEMKIYHGENHYFRPAAREDSVRETVEFFERHLGQSPS